MLWPRCGNVLTTSDSDVVTMSENDAAQLSFSIVSQRCDNVNHDHLGRTDKLDSVCTSRFLDNARSSIGTVYELVMLARIFVEAYLGPYQTSTMEVFLEK